MRIGTPLQGAKTTEVREKDRVLASFSLRSVVFALYMAMTAAQTYLAIMSGLVVINNVNAVARIYFV